MSYTPCHVFKIPYTKFDWHDSYPTFDEFGDGRYFIRSNSDACRSIPKYSSYLKRYPENDQDYEYKLL